VYIQNYLENFPPSEPSRLRHFYLVSPAIRGSFMNNIPPPEDEWDDRNLLYSLRYDLGAAVLIPKCNLRQVYVFARVSWPFNG
jgi:hypothetical protein